MADASANGLQVSGAEEITRIAVATDAALVTYRAAVERGCQLLFVHHGLIWGGITRIAGREHDHLKTLLDRLRERLRGTVATPPPIPPIGRHRVLQPPAALSPRLASS